MSIADIGRAENQPVSAEVREFLDDEIAQLQRRINELEEQAESFKGRIASQETTIRVQAETIARLEEEVHAFASRSAKELVAVVREDIVRSLQDEVVALREAIARLQEAPKSPPEREVQ